jgi:hypothetical protein
LKNSCNHGPLLANGKEANMPRSNSDINFLLWAIALFVIFSIITLVVTPPFIKAFEKKVKITVIEGRRSSTEEWKPVREKLTYTYHCIDNWKCKLANDHPKLHPFWAIRVNITFLIKGESEQEPQEWVFTRIDTTSGNFCYKRRQVQKNY